MSELQNSELYRLFEQARAAWPGIDVAFDVFVAHADNGGASLVAADPAAAAVNARDLYLACACSGGQSAAVAAFERLYLSSVPDAIARIDRSPDFTAEVQQVLRERLLVGPGAKIKEYRGNGALQGWVRTAAIRTALNLRRGPKSTNHQDLPQLEQLLDPEIAAIKHRHHHEIKTALARALQQLAPSDRLLLRLYYVDNLTLTKIAALQQCAVSTVFRHLSASTKTVLANVKSDLAHRLQLSAPSLDSLLRNVHDDMNISLTKLLGKEG